MTDVFGRNRFFFYHKQSCFILTYATAVAFAIRQAESPVYIQLKSFFTQAFSTRTVSILAPNRACGYAEPCRVPHVVGEAGAGLWGRAERVDALL